MPTAVAARPLPLVFRILAVALIASIGCTATLAADLVIGGDAGARHIVVPDDKWMTPEAFDAMEHKGITSDIPDREPMVYHAALLIQEYTRKITGATLDIVSETQWEREGEPDAVHVGRTRRVRREFGSGLDTLKNQGYVARSVPGRLLICGSSDWSTYNAAAGVLEKHFGVEWFWPGEVGEEVPVKDQLTFDRLNVTEEPVIMFKGSGWGPTSEWAARVGERLHTRMWNHALGPKVYHAGRLSNEEWFPLLDGERLIPEPTVKSMYTYWQPCMASPESLRRAVTAAEQHMLKTGQDSFSLCVNDGVWRGCECEYCKAADAGGPDPAFDTDPYHINGRYSSRYFKYLWHVGDALQEQFPGSKVTAFVYGGMDIPPADAKPNDNVVLSVISTKLAWLNPEFRKWEELRHRKWARLAGELVSYDYMYQAGYIPMYSPHVHAEAVRFLAEHGYTTYFAETTPTFARAGPRYWVHAKLCIDPSQDVDALLERWMNGMFKESAKPMADFYQAIEEAWVNYPFHERHVDGWASYCYFRGVDIPVLTPDTLARLEKNLDEAVRLAQDEKVKQRLKVIADNYLATRAYAVKLWRARPYRVPVPFDDQYVLDDLRDHLADAPIFDEKAHYEEHLKDQAVSYMSRLARRTIDTRATRFGRAVDGIVEPALRQTLTGDTFAISEVRAAIRSRVDALSATASAPDQVREHLHELSDRIVVAKKIDVSPKLDGRFDDAAWSGVDEYQGFYPETKDELVVDGSARNATTFRLAQDDTHFYLAIHCQQEPSSIVANAIGRDDAKTIAGDDRITVRLAPWQYHYRGAGGGLVVTVTAGGVVVEDGEGYGPTYWHAGTEARTTKTDDGYAVELAIPFRALLYSPERGQYVRFNVQRIVTGNDGQTSAWYPTDLGDTFACVEPFSEEGLFTAFDESTTEVFQEVVRSLPMTSDAWESYVLKEPSTVSWSGNEPTAAIEGGASVLLSKSFLPVQPGHTYELVANYAGDGAVTPKLNFFSATEVGMADVLSNKMARPLVDFDEPQVIEQDGSKLARVRVRIPESADHVRLRLEATDDVHVSAAQLVSHLPLEVTVDVDNNGRDEVLTGRVLAVQATIQNTSDSPVENLDVRMGFPSGVDLRAQAVTAKSTLQPGESTRALWWLTPVYAVGKADFTVIAEAKDMPRIVTKVRGPVKKVGK